MTIAVVRVVHTFGRNAGAEQAFAKEVVRFGRAHDNDVVFDAEYDRDASGHHAEVRREGGRWVVVDLASRNGTFVRGTRVTRCELEGGEEIGFGAKGPRVRIAFEVAAGAARAHVPEASANAAARPAEAVAFAGPPLAARLAEAAAPAAVQPEMAGFGAPTGMAPGPAAGWGLAASSPGAAKPPGALAREAFPRAAARPAEGAAFAPPTAARPAEDAAFAAPSAAARPVGVPTSGSSPAAARPVESAAFASPPRAARPAEVAPAIAAAPANAPPAAPAHPVAPPAGARVGQRTIAMMIAQAVSAASNRVRGPRTDELRAIVDHQVSAATAGHRRTTHVLAALLVVALAGLAGLVAWTSRSESEIARLRGDLARMDPEDPRRKEIERRLGTLHPSNANFGRNLYDRTKKGIFMLAVGGQGFCTAFAVRPNVLATNAHCIHSARRKGGSVVAVENEGRGRIRFGVKEMRPHPRYRDDDANAITPDVGALVIDGQAAVVLELATPQELAAAGAGDDVYIIGFPGRLMDSSNPAATFFDAHIGRITNAAGRPAPFAEAWLYQHDAPTTHGTSGSPIFDGRGKVVAVNAGGYLEEDEQTIAGRKAEVVRASPYKFGMRVDLLDAVLR